MRDADRVVGSKKEGTVRRENLRGVRRRIVAGDGRARVERPAAAKGESHENRRRGRRYECLFFFFSFYYPGRTRQTSSESVDGGGFSARESRDVSAHAEGEELRKSIDDDNDDDGIKCGE